MQVCYRAAALVLCAACFSPAPGQSIGNCAPKVAVGSPTTGAGDGGPALSAQFYIPLGAARDNAGNIYLADAGNNRVRVIRADGTVQAFAGTGIGGSSGDGGPASSARLNYPVAVALDSSGQVYIADSGNNKVRMVSTDGTIQTVAGTGWQGYGGDGGPAAAARLSQPAWLAFDAQGNLYIADKGNNRVRRVTKDGNISTYAGVGTQTPTTGDGGPAITGTVEVPSSLVFGADGTLYIAAGPQVESVTPDGLLHILAGDNNSGGAKSPAEGLAATLAQIFVYDIALDSQGNVLFVNDSPTTVWQIAPGGTLHHVADVSQGAGLLMQTDGTFLRTDSWAGQLLKYTAVPAATGQQFSPYTVVAGVEGHLSVGNNVPGTQATISVPQGLAVDASGNLYITDIIGLIHKLDTKGILTTIAGSSTATYPTPDGTPALQTAINYPTAVAVGPSGDIYYAEPYEYHVRKISTNGTVSTYAGNGQFPVPYNRFDTRDGSPATSAAIGTDSLAVDASGALYISDSFSRVMWKVTTDGILHLVAQSDGELPFEALAADPNGTVYYLEFMTAGVNNLVQIGSNSAPQVVRNIGNYLDGSVYAAAFAIDTAGSIYLSDPGTAYVAKSPSDSSVAFMINTTDPPSGASFNSFALDKSGNLWAGDYDSGRIFEIPAATACTPSLFPVIANQGVVNAASYAVPPAPGEIVTLFGFQIGPEKVVTGTIDASGQLATNVGNTQVFFDGVPAPLLYASSGQVASIIPYSAGGGNFTAASFAQILVQIVVNGFVSNTAYVQLIPAQPGIFTQNAGGSGPAAALNQDYSVNSPSNPAPKGSVVMVYATGLGALNPEPADGFLTGDTLYYAVQPVTAMLNGEQASVLYAGSAPGLMAGANQINIQIPADAASGDLGLTIWQGTSIDFGLQKNVTISVQ